MILAIMQPYVFPYLGYFQLMAAADRFVSYDDVTFIKQGWINRNRILLNGQPFLVTIPLVNASSNTFIADTLINHKTDWAGKLLKTIVQAYRKAPFFGEVYPLVEGVLQTKTATIAELAVLSLEAVNAYLGIETEIIPGSARYNNAELKAQERLLDICRQEGATKYVNPAGGAELYSKEAFAAQGIALQFIKPVLESYPQFGQPFAGRLSVIDALMFASAEEVRAMALKQEFA